MPAAAGAFQVGFFDGAFRRPPRSATRALDEARAGRAIDPRWMQGGRRRGSPGSPADPADRAYGFGALD
jgi:hypothetical protein